MDARTPNRLADETSPYLLQHAHNPVDWHPWGQEALQRAKDFDRPIFLSVGYSSCHWCHVMERESFENDEIAALLNKSFVSIKVDREERPDVDSIYMNAVQLLTRSGGWPMSVFLTPDLQPFWGGTYFPPEGRYGRPGFKDIVEQIAKYYSEHRSQVETAAAALTEQIQALEKQRPQSETPSREAIEAAVREADRTFDSTCGGFGAAPKFPRSIELSLLLRWHATTGDTDALRQSEKTLECMAHGGMYDQVGGGFHRYSTDRKWLVPHFEKMLYDNALLVRTYLEAFQVTKKELYSRIASEVLDYVLREMTGQHGGFYSATDADSEGEEGKFFVWTPEEITSLLGEEKARIVCDFYNITERGNFEHQTSIPHVTKSIEQTAVALDLDVAAVVARLAEARQELYEYRAQRIPPFRDEKVITAWNGLMISALTRGYQVLGDTRYLQAAQSAVGLILDQLSDDDQLYRTYKDGRAQHRGYLDDYAYFVEGLIDLYEASFDIAHLERACRYTDVALSAFWDDEAGGFFYTAAHHEALICRQKQYLDTATPSANGVTALNLLRLERLTGKTMYRDRAEETLRSAKVKIERLPSAMGSTLVALDFLLHPPVEIALLGSDEIAACEWLKAIHDEFVPRKVLAGIWGEVSSASAANSPLLAGKARHGDVTVYVCRDFACRAPATDLSTLRCQLSQVRGS